MWRCHCIFYCGQEWFMEALERFAKWLRNSRGVATSLVEATTTVAIGAVLASVAVGSALDAIDNSKVQAAVADVSTIGQGIITFYDKALLLFIKIIRFFRCSSTEGITGPRTLLLDFSFPKTGPIRPITV